MSESLNHSPADVIAQVLIDLGVATDPTDGLSWPVFVGSEPTAPDNVLTVYDTDGVQHGRSMIDGEIQEHFGFQVRVRATTHKVGFQKAFDVRRQLAENVAFRSVLLETDDYYDVHAVSLQKGIFSLGTENPASKRRLFTFNGLAVLTVGEAPVAVTQFLVDEIDNNLVDEDGNNLVGA